MPRPNRRAVRVAALALALWCGALTPLRAQAPDTARAPLVPFFTRSDAVLAAGFAVGAVGFAQLDRRLAHAFQDPGLQESTAVGWASDFFNWMGDPGIPVLGVALFAVGRVTHDRPIAALGLHGIEGVLLGSAITGTIKGVAGRARPYVHVDTVPDDFKLFRGFSNGTAYESFPSGHTTGAFAAAAVATAEVVHWTEVKGWWPGWPYVTGTALFGGATLVGLARMYRDQHWASDVVAGAAIGTFSGLEVVKYAYRHPRSRLERWLLPRAVVPEGGGALRVVWSVPD